MADTDFTTNPDEAKDRNFITALARGLDVLRCFRPNEVELSNLDFSQRTGLPKPTVSRLTHTLCKLDYLVADARTGTYRLGAGVLQLGFSVLSSLEIGERAAAELQKLCDGPNSYVTCALGERHLLEVIYVAVQRSVEDVSLTMHVGSRMPLFFSAIGRAVLVAMPEQERQGAFELANRERPDQEESRQISYAKAVKQYEENGFCSSYGEWRRDVNGVAVPVFSLNRDRIYGLNVGGPSFHVKKKQLENYYAKRLFESAKMLSLQP